MNKAAPSLAAGLIIAAVCLLDPVRADDSALLQLLEVLHENGTINDEAYDKLRAAAAADLDRNQAEGEERKATAQNAKPDGETARVEFEGRKLRVESADRQFALRLGGRLMADVAHYDDDINPLGDGSEMRRVRLSWDARLARDWELNGAVEFAGGTELKSTYIDYLGFPDRYIRFGNYKEPVSLEELSSSKYTTFMERAMLTELVPGRNIGLGGGGNTGHWGFAGGAFVVNDDGQDEQDAGFGVTGRVFYSPWHEDSRAVHLGLSASYREPGDSHSARFRARPESHVTDVRLVDTGTIGDVDSVTWIGLESALVVDSFSLQAEYLNTGLARGSGLPDPRFEGWYAYASWFPTGESRSYDARDGEFGRISPRRPLGAGGAGAFELGLRFSRLDLSDEDIAGGREDNLTFGLNWYPASNVRFMANYIRVLDVDRPGSEFDGDTPSIFQIRGQADF